MAVGAMTPNEWSELQAACAQAVQQSQAESARLRQAIARVVSGLSEKEGGRSEPAGEILRMNHRVAEDLAQVAGQRARCENSLTVALFGRTGAGKSTLVEAFSHGSGGRISPGQSDYTRQADSEPLGYLSIIDTPGVAGWGRGDDPAVLRRQAAEAVAPCDLVLLCFDSAPRDSEYAIIADCVSRYGKPVVAVLNLRDRYWRYPPRPGYHQAREEGARQVRQLAAMIGQHLGEIGLPGTPVVAVNAKNAAFARAPASHYAGPDQVGCEARLARAGSAARLLEWSNLPALELLMAEIVRRHAADLRMSALRAQVRAAATRAEQEFETTMRELIELAEQAERAVERILRLLGPPESLTTRPGGTSAAQLGELTRQLGELQALRGARFAIPPRGSALQYAGDLVTGRAEKLRRDALDRADALITEAMRQRRNIEPTPLVGEDELGLATAELTENFRDFLSQSLTLVAEDLLTDVASPAGPEVRVRGKSGRGYARWGTGIGAVSVFAPFAPPWGLVLAPVGTAASRRLRQLGTVKQARELGRSRAEARQSASEWSDDFRTGLTSLLEAQAQQALADRLGEMTSVALGLRRDAASCARSRDLTAALRAQVPEAGNPKLAVAAAVRACETAPGATRTPEEQWLGESLPDDADLPVPSARTQTADGEPRRDVAERVLAALGAGWVDPDGGRRWLEEFAVPLADDPATASFVARLSQLSRAAVPCVVFCGDTQAGKTALIRRLHWQAGLPVPREPQAESAAGPESATSRVRSYPWLGGQLVDTPGLQQPGGPGADTLEAIAGATVVVYMATPAGVGGDLSQVRAVLEAASAGQVLLVLSRADQLGADPLESPGEFAALQRLKEAELRAALRRHVGGRDRWPEPVCLAPRPLEGGASWDGTAEFAEALQDQMPVMTAHAGAAAVLGLAAWHLTRLAGEASADRQRLRLRAERLSALGRDTQACLSEAELAGDEARRTFRRMVEEFTERLLQDSLSAAGKHARSVALRRLKTLKSDAELAALTDEWDSRTRATVARLMRATSASLGDQVSAVTADTALDRPEFADMDVSPLGGSRRRGAAAILSGSASLVGRLDAYLESMGLAETAITAIRLARPYLAAGGTLLAAGEQITYLARRGHHERARAQSITQLHALSQDWAQQCCDCSPALTRLAEYRAELVGLAAETTVALAAADQELRELTARINLYTAAASAAVRLTPTEADRTGQGETL